MSPNQWNTRSMDLRETQSDLIGRIRRGDNSALSDLYDCTSSQVFGLVLRIVHDRSAAEEITVDVYTQVWKQAGKFDPARGSLWAWLMILARSRAIDFLRSRAHLMKDKEEELDTAVRDIGDRLQNPEEQLLSSRRRRVVLDALASLEPARRTPLELAFFSGLTHQEIAERLGAPLGTVKTRIRSALIHLREQLELRGEAL